MTTPNHHPRTRGRQAMSETSEAEVGGELLTKIAAMLAELYDPAGVLMFWSARIKYLDDRRPCDLWRDRDMDGLETLWRRLEALADAPHHRRPPRTASVRDGG